VSVLLSRPSTVRAVRAVGQDGLAVRTGQLRSTRSRLTRIACVAFASTRETLVVALRGSAPRGASRDGPPAPRRLGQPSPCTSPISDVLRRHRGHCLAGSRTGGKLARSAPCGLLRVFTRATETAPTPRLAARRGNNRDAFRRVSTDRVAPVADPTSAFLFEMRCVVSHTVLTSEPPPRVSARWCGVLLGQRRVADLPCGSSCVATRDASDRLLPTHVLRTSTRASSVPDASCACAPARSRGSPASHQSDSLRWATRFVVLSPRWALSSRRDACDPDLWHLCRLPHGCHVARATCASVGAAETALDPIA
jgi:hypothetical protein